MILKNAIYFMEYCNIVHICKSKHIIIDSTFHLPYQFHQCLIVMYKDIITSEKYPAFYIIMNKRYYQAFDLIFKSIIQIITYYNNEKLNFISITSDDKPALLKALKNNFKSVNNFLCLFHLKKNLIEQIKLLGLFKKNDRDNSLLIINQLCKLCIDYKGSISYINTLINVIIYCFWKNL